MIDFSKKSETKKYFNSIMDNLKQSKIKRVFQFFPVGWSSEKGYRIYQTSSEFYILLENDYCLIISYPFIDALNVQFRNLTDIEVFYKHDMRMKNMFDTVDEIHKAQTDKIHTIETYKLECGSIVDVSLRSVTSDYNKWLDGGLDMVSPTKETFDEIKFTMSNGKSFVICADDAQSDGWTLLWSEDAEETITIVDKEID